MPFDKGTQVTLGLFHGLPSWWKKHQAELQRQRGRELPEGGERVEDEPLLALEEPTERAGSGRGLENAMGPRPHPWRVGNVGNTGPGPRDARGISCTRIVRPERPSPYASPWGPIGPPSRAPDTGAGTNSSQPATSQPTIGNTSNNFALLSSLDSWEENDEGANLV